MDIETHNVKMERMNGKVRDRKRNPWDREDGVTRFQRESRSFKATTIAGTIDGFTIIEN